jgi:histidinol-phosphate phosphatase family protein
MSLSTLNIDPSWTLFLDRDGVINRRIVDDYVKKWEDFEFLEDVLKAMEIFDKKFGRIVIVTNQQGIGKGLMRHEDLELIHKNMQYEISYFKGRIDKIYFSPYLALENHADRKPGIGMALKAKKDFPEIDFSKALMVGDSGSDMEFGKAAGMRTVFIGETNKYKADFLFPTLYAFACDL